MKSRLAAILFPLLAAGAFAATPESRLILGERNSLLGETNREVSDLSPDGGRALLLAQDGRVEMLDPQDRRVLSSHRPPIDVKAIEFLGKHRLLGWGTGGRIASWDAQTGESSATLRSGGDEFRRPFASADGTRIAFADELGIVSVVDARTGGSVATLGKATDDFYRRQWELALSPDGKMAASGDWAGNVHVWNVDRAAIVWSTRAFSGDAEMVSRGVAGPHFGTPDSASSLAFSPDGRLLAVAGQKGEILLFDARSGGFIRREQMERGPAFEPRFHPDGKSLIAGDRDGGLRRFRVFSGKDVFSVKGKAELSRVSISSDGLRITALDRNGMVVVKDGRTGRDVGAWGQRTVWRAVYSRDGSLLATAGAGERIEIFSMPVGERRREIETGDESVYMLAFSSDGARLASIGYSKSQLGRNLRVWDVASGKQMWEGPLKGFSFAERFAFAPDGRTLIAGEEKHLVVWDARSGKRLKDFAYHPNDVDDVAVSPDGRYAATGCQDSRIRLWILASGKRVFEAPADAYPYSWTKDVFFSADGKQVLGWDRNRGRYYRLSVPAGRTIETIKLDTTTREVFPSIDGRLAVSKDDNTLQKWTAYMLDSRGDRKMLFENLRGVGAMVALSPDGRDMVTAGDDGLLRVWSLPP